MKNRKLGIASILIPLLFSVAFVSVNLFEYNKLSKIQDNWSFYYNHTNKKKRLLSSIRDNLGYNGIIHHFKNYVLRKTPDYRELLISEHEKLNDNYNILFSLLNERERNSINNLSDVIDRYYSMIAVADDAIARGLNSEEIDRLVKIDDKPAVLAIRDINKELNRDLDILSTEIESLLSDIVKINLGSLIFIIIFVVIISGVTFRYFYLMINESRKLAKVKSSFLANIGHEIKTPLNGIVGFIELIDERELDKNTAEYLSYIRGSSNLLVKMVNDILDYSKIERHELQLNTKSTKIEDIILSTIDQFLPIAREKKIEINYKIGGDIPEFVIIDEARVSQVLTNLISNAVKFIFEGNISVILSKKLHKDKAYLNFDVIDTGPGMSRALLDKVFVPFEQGDTSMAREYSGTGLGLSIVQKVVSGMKGLLDVHSEEGKGTTISFAIPLVEGEFVDDFIISFKDFTPNENDKVLIAEDNKINQKVALNILKRIGYKEIVIAENGVEAVVKSDINDFNIILMDIQMPKMTGIDATVEIRRISQMKSADQPLIIGLSASVLQKDKALAMDHGMDDFIDKPLTIEKLKKSLTRLT